MITEDQRRPRERRPSRWPVKVVVAGLDAPESVMRVPLPVFAEQGVDLDLHPDAASALIAVGEGDVGAVVVCVGSRGVDLHKVVGAVTRYAGVPALVGIGSGSSTELAMGALDAGARGLLNLPLDPTQLVTVLRQLEVGSVGAVVKGGVVLDSSASELRIGDKVLTLSGGDFQLIEALVVHHPHAVPLAHLLRVTDGEQPSVRSLNSLRAAVGRMRRRLALEGFDGDRVLRAVRGVGYRWHVPESAAD